MKNIIFFILILPQISFAQTFNGINYQAIAYDSNGFEIANQNLELKFSILNDSVNGLASYVETHTVTTDDFGLFSVVIGQGNSQNNFNLVNWKGINFLKTQILDNNQYMTLGTHQFFSVPYSYYSKKSEDTDKLKTLMYLSNGF